MAQQQISPSKFCEILGISIHEFTVKMREDLPEQDRIEWEGLLRKCVKSNPHFTTEEIAQLLNEDHEYLLGVIE